MSILHPILLCSLALLLWPTVAGASPITIGFDELVVGGATPSYAEDGFLVTAPGNLFASDVLVPDPPAMFPSSANLPIQLARTSEGPFDLLQIDLRELNAGVGAQTVDVVGITASGGAVSARLVTDGACCGGPELGFETFALPESFRGLVSATFTGFTPVHDNWIVEIPAIRFDELDAGLTSFTEGAFTLISAAEIVPDALAPEPPAVAAAEEGQRFELFAEAGGVFAVYALDVRELSPAVGAATIRFEARAIGGNVVQHDVQLDGVCCDAPDFGFETVELPPSFRQILDFTWADAAPVVDTIEAVPVAPGNDDAAVQYALVPNGVPRPYTLVRATNDAPVSLGDSAANPDVWFSLFAPEDALLTVDTCGSHDAPGQDEGPDTVVTLHSGLPASDDNQVAGNDDAPDGDAPGACGGSDAGEAADAAVRTAVQAGTFLIVRVASAGASPPGDFQVRLTVPEPNGAAAAALAMLAAIAWRRRGTAAG